MTTLQRIQSCTFIVTVRQVGTTSRLHSAAEDQVLLENVLLSAADQVAILSLSESRCRQSEWGKGRVAHAALCSWNAVSALNSCQFFVFHSAFRLLVRFPPLNPLLLIYFTNLVY